MTVPNGPEEKTLSRDWKRQSLLVILAFVLSGASYLIFSYINAPGSLEASLVATGVFISVICIPIFSYISDKDFWTFVICIALIVTYYWLSQILITLFPIVPDFSSSSIQRLYQYHLSKIPNGADLSVETVLNTAPSSLLTALITGWLLVFTITKTLCTRSFITALPSSALNESSHCGETAKRIPLWAEKLFEKACFLFERQIAGRRMGFSPPLAKVQFMYDIWTVLVIVVTVLYTELGGSRLLRELGMRSLNPLTPLTGLVLLLSFVWFYIILRIARSDNYTAFAGRMLVLVVPFADWMVLNS